MTEPLDVGQLANLASPSPTLAWYLDVEPEHDAPLYLTSHDRPLVIGARTYESSPSFVMSAVAQTVGYEPGSLELTIVVDPYGALALYAGRLDGATVRVGLVNPFDTALTPRRFGRFFIDNIRPQAPCHVIEAVDACALWSRSHTFRASKSCQDRLGGPRCRLALAPFMHSFEVTAVTSARVFTIAITGSPALAPIPDRYFENGEIMFASGVHASFSRRVHANTGGLIALPMSLVQVPTVGATGTIVRGCRQEYEQCRVDFGNQRNFYGSPHAPTLEQLAGGGVDNGGNPTWADVVETPFSP